MDCPKCGGNTYDNRAENDARLAKGEKMRPDYKCKDKACDGCVWRPKEGWGARAAGVGAGAVAPVQAKLVPQKEAHSAGPYIPEIDGERLPTEKLDHLYAVYAAIEDHILTVSVPKWTAADVGTTPESVAAQIHTLYIDARKAGV